MASEHEDYSLKVQNWQGRISETVRTHSDGDEYISHSGAVATPHGYVTVYADNSRLPCAGLDFIWRGRNYHRSWRRYWRPRQLVTLAKRFAKDIAQEGMTDGDS